MNLPIDVVPNTSPPRFKWRHVVDSPVGRRIIDHTGMLPTSVEAAIVALIDIVKQQVQEIDKLKQLEQQRQYEAQQRIAAAAPLRKTK